VDEEDLEQALMHLYELGLVSVEYDENLEARFRVSDPDRLKRLIDTLEEGQKDV
jgi:hypothetical protein